jgi:solute carrier family 25 carnitine/acylcarnitine transporter 20/29
LFSTYGKICKIGLFPSESLANVVTAGAGAGLVGSIIVSPIELVKIRLQNQRGQGKTFSTVLRELMKIGIQHGIFRGLKVTIMKEIPANAGY